MTESCMPLPLSLLACPQCHSALTQCDDTLVCSAADCNLGFACHDGVPELLLPAKRSVRAAAGPPEDGSQTVTCDYPTARKTTISPTSPFCHYAITNRLILRHMRHALSTLTGTGVNFGAGTITYDEFLPDTATMWCVDIHTQPETEVHLLSDIQNCGIATGRLDWILCTSVLEHIPDPRRAMAEMARCLKPGGQLILTVPQTFPLHGEPGDYWRFTQHGIRILANETDLSVAGLCALGSTCAVTWQQRAASFQREHGGRADASLSWPKRLVLNSLAITALVNNVLCCALAGRATTASTTGSDVLLWGAVLKKKGPLCA